MLVYKYTSAYAGKLIIESSSVRFSQREVLNDPFELTPSFNLLKKSVKAFIRNGFEMTDDFKRMTYIEKESLIQKNVRPFIDGIEAVFKVFLVLSLTKKEENLLMWSHYADSHRGLVIGFDYDNPFFHQTENPEITVSYDMEYSTKRPTFFNYQKIRTRDVLPEEIKFLFLTKSLWWEYEEEIRMFALASAATNVKKVENGFDIYLFDFPKDCLKQIIFGSLMKSDDKKEISEIANRLYPHVKLLEAAPSETEFALKFKPYRIS